MGKRQLEVVGLVRITVSMGKRRLEVVKVVWSTASPGRVVRCEHAFHTLPLCLRLTPHCPPPSHFTPPPLLT